MLKRTFAAGAVVAMLMVGMRAAGPPRDAAANQVAVSRSAALERAIAQEISRRGGVGATVAIVENGRPLLAKGFGRRSVGSPAPVDSATLFGIGSVTKQFTAAAALLLAEQGKLSVSDTVANYYPGATRANDITVLDLMNHVSGYPDYYPLDFVDRRMQQPIDPDDLIRQYAGAPLDFEPGTRWSYSNTGFVLLGRILEKASGQPLGSFMREKIFDPLGMTHTAYDPKADDRRVASGFTSFALTPLTRAIREGDGWVGAAGAIYSTAEDIARWDVALMEGRVLKPESWALMTRPRVLANGKSSNYGCGLSVATRDGLTVYTHGGAVSGFIARNTFIPQTRSAVVVVINDEDGPLANAIVEHGLRAALPAQAATVPVTTGPSAARADRGEIPRVDGPEPGEKALAMFKALQSGTLDRPGLGAEYSVYVTAAMARAAAIRLRHYGKPTGVTVRSVGERGGLEVSSVRVAFGDRSLDALMYRSRDGKVQEYLLFRP
jgi:CubicO group peptidase (beta-lactamase class C family)